MSEIKLINGDCKEVLLSLQESSIDTCITDPPYGLEFMGKGWDHSVPGIDYWKEVYRVLKPGAMLLAFGGTRTYHRLTCAIEDAGFEIRDCLMWVYGSGFPKSFNISKAIDKAAGAEREVIGVNEDYLKRKPNGMKTSGANSYNYSQVQQETNANITAPATDEAKLWDGWGTALKPAWEPIIVAMKPLEGTFIQNALNYGVAGLNIDGCRIAYQGDHDITKKVGSGVTGENNPGCGSNLPSYKENWGTWEANNSGRWPANVIHDGSDEVLDLFPETKSGTLSPDMNIAESRGWSGGSQADRVKSHFEGSQGSAARFFYCAKASRSERHCNNVTNNHPTVKPIKLLQWLVKLTSTPTGGIVLDPFCGSGSTGLACKLEGRSFVGIEIDEKYFKIAEQRINGSGISNSSEEEIENTKETKNSKYETLF